LTGGVNKPAQMGPNPAPGGIMRKIAALMKSRSAVGAVEFALVAPILIILYLMSFELTVAISTSRKVSQGASDVADLVTQQTAVSKTFLNTMYDVTQSILAPYSTTGLTLKITGITVDAASKPTVTWSWKNGNTTPYTPGSAVTVPSDLKIANSFLVHAEVSLPHSILFYLPGLSGTSTNTFTISREFYFRQRVGSNVTCSDC
jgi:Flp pilus assembly protein TadG